MVNVHLAILEMEPGLDAGLYPVLTVPAILVHPARTSLVVGSDVDLVLMASLGMEQEMVAGELAVTAALAIPESDVLTLLMVSAVGPAQMA